MGSKLQDMRNTYDVGDHVLVSRHGPIARKAIIRNMESNTVRVQYAGGGLVERVRIKDIQLDPDFAPKPRIETRVPSASTGPEIKRALQNITTGFQQPPTQNPNDIPRRAVIALVADVAPIRHLPTTTMSTADKPPTPVRLSSWLRTWRKRHSLSIPATVDLGDKKVFPEFRLGFIENGNTVAETQEIAILAAIIEGVEGSTPAPPGGWISRLTAMRDADSAAGVRTRVRQQKPGIKRDHSKRVVKTAIIATPQPSLPAKETPLPPPASTPAVPLIARPPATSSAPLLRFSVWLRDWRGRRNLTIAQVAGHCKDVFPEPRIGQVELRKIAAEDDELLALIAYLETVEEPGIDWLTKLSAMRDLDVAAGVLYRVRRAPRSASPVVDPTPPKAPTPIVEVVAAPEPVMQTPPAPVADLPNTVSVNIGGVRVEGTPAEIRLLLGLK